MIVMLMFVNDAGADDDGDNDGSSGDLFDY